jgi:hypothetical protein
VLNAREARAILCEMRLATVSLWFLFAVAAGLDSAEASAGHASTKAYLGESKTMAAMVSPQRSGVWSLDCDYVGGFVDASPRHRIIHAHFMDEHIGGLARIRSGNTWAVYELVNDLEPPPFPRKLVGFVVQRTPTRWDIVRKGRKIGYTVGPDGPEVATALLTVCGS